MHDLRGLPYAGFGNLRGSIATCDMVPTWSLCMHDLSGLPYAGSGTYEVRSLRAIRFLRGTCACMT